jgi:hypothetical protein
MPTATRRSARTSTAQKTAETNQKYSVFAVKKEGAKAMKSAMKTITGLFSSFRSLGRRNPVNNTMSAKSARGTRKNQKSAKSVTVKRSPRPLRRNWRTVQSRMRQKRFTAHRGLNKSPIIKPPTFHYPPKA